jgi:peptidoglycan/LPS O-acetylase OafA/YrhL
MYYRGANLTKPILKFFFLGYAGVDIFFVLSGFILVGVYQNLQFSGLARFAMRRILRIYPMHLAVLGAMACMTCFSFVWYYNAVDWHTLFQIALLIQPLTGLIHGYWNGVTWSAGVELTCYALFPALLFSLRRLPMPAFALLVLGAGYWDWHIQTIYDQQWAGFPCIERGWGDFGFGMALGLLATRVTLPGRVAAVGELLAAAALLAACAALSYRFVPLCAGALIWMLAHERGPVARFLSLRALVFLGKISFSIYLLHMPLMDVCQHLWPIPWLPPATPIFYLREIVFFALLIGLSSLTYAVIERPAQNLFRRPKSPAIAADTGRLSVAV